MLAGNSSISLKPVSSQDKSNSTPSNQPVAQTLASSLSSAGSSTIEVAGCSVTVGRVSPSSKNTHPSAENSHEKDHSSPVNFETGEYIREEGPAAKKAKVDESLLSSEQPEADATMKGDVATAPMPSVMEARSPMINIPVGIVKEFMNANSPLAADADRGTKSSKPTTNGTVSLTLREINGLEANGELSGGGSVGSTGSRSSSKSNKSTKSTKSSKSAKSNGTHSPVTCNGVSPSPRSGTPVNSSIKSVSGVSSASSTPHVTSASTSVTSQLSAAASILAGAPETSTTRLTTSAATPMDSSVSVSTSINSSISKSELRNFNHLGATSESKEATKSSNSTGSMNGDLDAEDALLDPLNCNGDMLPDLSGNADIPAKTAEPSPIPATSVDSLLSSSSALADLAPSTIAEEPVPASPSSLPAGSTINGTTVSNQSKNLDVRNGLLSVGKENSFVGDLNGLKRSLDSDSGSNDTKKQRLSSQLQDSAATEVSFGNLLSPMKTVPGDDNKMLIEAEMETIKKTASKLHKLKRKDLESLIIDLFMNKLLHNHELGRYKSLCEKLEATLEANRKKTAQFHKEMDDLRKVTKRLREEHQARKEQLITPIKIKRSVGIQAAPHIIQKGLASAHTAQATITPKRGAGSAGMQSSGANGLTSMNAPHTGPQQMVLLNQSAAGVSPSSNYDNSMSSSSPYMRTSQGGVRLGLVSSSSPSSLMASSSSPSAAVASTTDGSRRSFYLAQPLVSSQGASATTPAGGGLFSVAGGALQTGYGGGGGNGAMAASTGRGSNSVIDLTDEEEGRAPLKAPQQTLVKMTPNTASFVTLPVQSGPGLAAGGAQYVLVPSSVGNSTLMVTNVANNAATVSIAGNPNPSLTASATRLLVTAGLPGTKPPSLSTIAPPLNTPLPQHPAPLPRTAPQQVVGGAMQLPPQPTLKLSHKANSIVLSWTMAETVEHEAIASYQLYAYQESSQTPSPSLWKKVGSVKALELPMACTLTQFMPGHRYHFAVRAVDAKSRLGPFSDPRSIRLEK